MAESHKMKMTEIGPIPQDWDVLSLSDIGRFSKGTGITREQANSGPIPCIRYGEIYTSHDNFIRRFYSHISPELAKTATRIKTGDILFAGSGETKEEIGKAVAFIGKEEAYAGGDIIILSPKIPASPKYLGFVLNDQIAISQKSALGQGDAVVHIHAKELANVQIPFPHPFEQEKIATVLSDIDSLVIDLEKVIVKKRMMKQGSMQQLLTGKVRLKGFSKPWHEMELGQLVDIKRGSMLKSSEYQFGTIPVIAGGITPAGYHNVANRTGRTITVSASGANAGYVSMHVGPIFATDCSTISESKDKSYFIDFVYQYLVLHQLDIFRAQTGGAQPHIHPKDISPMKIEVPDYDEQFKIATYLSTMDKEIAALEAERDKYKNIKQGMKQKLLTGQIRLPV